MPDDASASLRGRVLRDEPMARHTSFRIGGPADLLVEPADPEDAIAAVRWAYERGYPLTVIGNGTNLLVSDRGIRGMTLIIGRTLSRIQMAGDRIIAEAGAPLMKVAVRAGAAGLAGMEFAEGIPGTLGGAIYMNAGTLLGEVKDTLTSVRVVRVNGEEARLKVDDLGLAYRSSNLSKTRDIALSAEFSLREASSDDVSATMQRLRNRRHASQPHWERSAGCVFKNPDGQSAGRLLDDAKTKGWREGDAEVSDRHANFVVNKSAATAENVVILMSRMRARVRDRYGVELHPEIEFIGEWDPRILAELTR